MMNAPRQKSPRSILIADWSAPDNSIIRPDRPPAPVMAGCTSLTPCSAPWADWLRTAAEVKGAPVDFVALALLSTASAIIGNTRWAVPWDGWKEPPIIWGMLIGDPSSGKSPASGRPAGPREANRQRPERGIPGQPSGLGRQGRSRPAGAGQVEDGRQRRDLPMATILPAKPNEADAGAPPVSWPRQDHRHHHRESRSSCCSDGWRGLLLSRDELSGWLGGMDRYSGGG